jgi:hypothetical protein
MTDERQAGKDAMTPREPLQRYEPDFDCKPDIFAATYEPVEESR